MAFGDLVPVLSGPVLVGEADEIAGGIETRSGACLSEEQECEEPGCFGFVGHEVVDESSETYRLGGEVRFDEFRTRRGW